MVDFSSKLRKRVSTPAPSVEPEAFINKYRPKTWDELVGQERACKAVDAAMAVNTHTFLLCGEAGTGKTSTARLIASSLGAELVEQDAAFFSGVEAMRSFVSTLTYQSMAGKNGRRFALVDECHKLSAEAWSVLLKPTEEPDTHVYFGLCTTLPGKVPATIRSRCAQVDLVPVGDETLFNLLGRIADAEKFTITNRGLTYIVEAAAGSVRLALSMLAATHSMGDADVKATVQAAGDAPEIIELARGLTTKRLQWPRVVETLAAYEGSAETVRLLMVNYTSKVLLSTTDAKKAVSLLAILDAFREPCNPSEKMAPVLRMFGYVMLGG